jgi:hypothetical protein
VTLDGMRQRDARIAALEAIPARARTSAEQEELGQLLTSRTRTWTRFEQSLENARRRVADYESYARQAGFHFLLEKADA